MKLGDSIWRMNERRLKGARKRGKKKSFYYPKNNGTDWAWQRLEMPLLHNNNRGRHDCACALLFGEGTLPCVFFSKEL